ncbi:MAG TPA: hypothetical protein VEY06_03355 [Flavisolibacter sp.]|nr:hypothetical protein [Flavisolibacter sp.]
MRQLYFLKATLTGRATHSSTPLRLTSLPGTKRSTDLNTHANTDSGNICLKQSIIKANNGLRIADGILKLALSLVIRKCNIFSLGITGACSSGYTIPKYALLIRDEKVNDIFIIHNPLVFQAI